MPNIELKEISKSYAKKLVLNQVSFQIKPKTCTAIVGTNGKGKTTLLNILAGLHQADSGQYLMDGADYRKKKHHWQKNTAYLMEKPELFATLSIKENILGLSKIKGRQIDTKYFDELVTKFQLTEFLNKKANQVSTGVQYKSALIRSLICLPQILILDEPNANVDNDTILIVKKVLNELKDKSSANIILVSHQFSFIEKLADNLIFLNNSVIKQLTSDELFQLTRRPILEIDCHPIDEEQLKKLAEIDPNLQINQNRNHLRMTLKDTHEDHNAFLGNLMQLGIKIKQFQEVPISPEQLYKKIIAS